jgi:8-oxo-dGTP pyrophosphatase MutT (NUDIX family)
MPTTAYYRAAVGAFILNSQNQLLIVLKHGYGDKWNTFKGGIDRGETELETLARELFEELGITKYEVIARSKLPFLQIRPDIDRNTTEHIGQAWSNYWLRLSDSEQISVPNEELEQVMWIDVTAENISKYIAFFDPDRYLATYLPLEFAEIVGKSAH